jgi:hypothetical protein
MGKKPFDVIDTLAELSAIRGVSHHIRSDHGLEFLAHAIQRWLKQVGVEALYIEPGSPWENGFAEAASATSLWRWKRLRACCSTETDRGLEERLQRSPTAQLAGVCGPARVRGPQHCFRYACCVACLSCDCGKGSCAACRLAWVAAWFNRPIPARALVLAKRKNGTSAGAGRSPWPLCSLPPQRSTRRGLPLRKPLLRLPVAREY